MTDVAKVESGKTQIKKGLIVALLLGVAMVYLPYLISFVTNGRFFRFNALLLVEMCVSIAAIELMSKNIKISIALLIAYIALVIYNHPIGSLIPFLPGNSYLYFDYKYTNGIFIVSARICEFVLVALTLYGLNKANKAISIIASLLCGDLDSHLAFRQPDLYFLFFRIRNDFPLCSIL